VTTGLVRRATHLYDLPLAERVEILHPELAVLSFGGRRTIDVGVLCYKQRVMPDTTTRNGGRRVVLKSLDVSRFGSVQRLISHISASVRYGRLRLESLHSSFTRLIAYVNWADMQGFADVLVNDENARTAFRAYVSHIRDRVARNDISLNAGAKQQGEVARAIGRLYDIEDFERAFNLLRKDSNTSEVTSPPSETSQGRVLAICTSLFSGLSAFALEKRDYPYCLEMPSYLGFPNDSLWVFPGTSWFKTPSMLAASKTNAGYDFANGRLSTAEELKIEYPAQKTSHRWQDVLRDARIRVDSANADFNHRSRWRLGTQAFHAYFILFIAATGMNLAQVTELPWVDDEYEVEITRQGFRTIKWRAGGKNTSFELPIAALPAFKKFLELRKFVLQGRKCEYLFFRSLTPEEPARRYLSGLDTTYKLLNRLDPSLDMISAREWRAAKSDWLVRNTDPATAALVLQNTEKTVLRSYAEGSETRHFEEMGTFLGQVASAVVARDDVIAGGTPRSVGVCSSFGAPVQTTSSTPVTPDCRGSEGCLFCDKLKVHADERDTRKLLSCRYCIRLATPPGGSFESFEKLVQPVLDRIDQILGGIAERDPEMVQRVTQEVDEEGELDPYWASKASMLMSLEF